MSDRKERQLAMQHPVAMREDRETTPEDRLRRFVRSVMPGQCKKLSVGDACTCPLCDIDRLCDPTSPTGGPSDAER